MTIPTRSTLNQGVSHARERASGLLRNVILGVIGAVKLLPVALLLIAAFALMLGLLRIIPGIGWLLLLAFPVAAYWLGKLVAYWLGTRARGRVAWDWTRFRERLSEDNQVAKAISIVALVIVNTVVFLIDAFSAQETLGADLGLLLRWGAFLAFALIPLFAATIDAIETLPLDSGEEAPTPEPEAAPLPTSPRIVRRPAGWD